MKFVLFCEGHTEKKALPAFLKRWLDPRLNSRVGIKAVRFEGWRELVDDMPKKARMYLGNSDVVGVIALLDLYGPKLYPNHVTDADERFVWAKRELEEAVDHPKFRQFFAVHEIEAWLFSDPGIFPREIKSALTSRAGNPEGVDFDRPPYVLLNDLYRRHTKRGYKKVTYGKQLFDKLNPEVAYEKCSRLGELLEEMLSLAVEAGL